MRLAARLACSTISMSLTLLGCTAPDGEDNDAAVEADRHGRIIDDDTLSNVGSASCDHALSDADEVHGSVSQ